MKLLVIQFSPPPVISSLIGPNILPALSFSKHTQSLFFPYGTKPSFMPT